MDLTLTQSDYFSPGNVFYFIFDILVVNIIDYLKLLYVTYKKECMKTVSLYLSIFKSVTIPLGGIEISKSGYWGKLNFASQSPSSNFSPFSQ